jgi:hypothetical protein
MTASGLQDLAKTLSDAGLAVCPLPEAGVLVFFDDEFHERHDYDIVGPRARSAVAAVLGRKGWKHRRATRLEGPSGESLVFPRPAAALSASPLDALLEARNNEAFLAATPTQALMLGLDEDWPLDELEGLLRAMPANLPKVRAWARGRSCAGRLKRDAEALDAAQKAGILARRRR